MSTKVTIFFALVGMTFAAPQYNLPQPQQSYQQPSAPQPTYQRPSKPSNSYKEPEPAPASYDFDWSVKDDYSGNDFGQTESRDGYNTQGSYYVLLPDTRLMKVTYSVSGDSGFVADVSFEGEAQYPQASNVYQQSQPKPSNAYSQPKISNAYSQPQSNRYN